MKIKPGAEVVDKKGKILGFVDHLARDGWTGEIRKFIVNRTPPAKDLFLTPEDILEATETKIRLKSSFNESSRDT